MFFFFAEAHHHPGLIDVIFDFKSNVINWLFLVGFLVYAWSKMVPPMLEKRAKSIEDAIASSKQARFESEVFLKEQKGKLENAQKEADKIVDEAKSVAQQLKAEIEAQTTREVADLEKKLQAAIDNERQMIVTEVRTAAAKAAVQLSRSYLEKNVTEADNKRLLTQFMQQLDSLSGPDGTSFAPGTALGVSSRSDK